MNLLALDQSTRSTGWCHMVDGDVVEFGILKTPTGIIGLEAALWQTDAIEELAVSKSIDTIALEHLYIPASRSGKNGKPNPETVFLLGELKGMIAHVAHQHGWQFIVVTSPEVCDHIGVSPFTPRKQKKLTSRHVAAMDIYGDRMRYVEIPEDAADAIAIAGVASRKLVFLGL